MKYYKELNLDFSSVISKILEITTKNPSNNFWTTLDPEEITYKVPELVTIIEPLKLSIARISLVTCVTLSSKIHRDVTPFKTRLNIPILNCEHSTTSFFVCTDESKSGIQRYQSTGVLSLTYNENICRKVDSFTLTKPTLLRVQELHQVRVHNITKCPRISCSIAFNEDIEHLWDDNKWSAQQDSNLHDTDLQSAP